MCDMGDKQFEKMSTTEMAMWLQKNGFSVDVQEAFEGKIASHVFAVIYMYNGKLSVCRIPIYTEQGMDGEATVAAFATCPGPDCIKEVVPKYGYRVKVYNAIRAALNENYQQRVLVCLCVHDSSITVAILYRKN